MLDARALPHDLQGQAVGFDWLEKTWRAFQEAATNLSISLGIPLCVENCGLCCTVNTPTALKVEVERAASHVWGLPPLERERILDRIEEWLLRPVLEIERPLHPEMSVKAPQLGGGKGTPVPPAQEMTACLSGRCPLLNDQLRCSVYEVRPLACRAYGVTHQVSWYCKRPRGLGETGDMKASTSEMDTLNVEVVLAALGEALRETGHTDLLHWRVFPTALYGLFRPKRLVELMPQIASVKLSGGAKGDPAIIFQSQLEWHQAQAEVRRLNQERIREAVA